MPYCVMDLSQHCFNQLRVAWRQQVIIWNNVDLSVLRFYDIHLWGTLQRMPKLVFLVFYTMILKNYIINIIVASRRGAVGWYNGCWRPWKARSAVLTMKSRHILALHDKLFPLPVMFNCGYQRNFQSIFLQCNSVHPLFNAKSSFVSIVGETHIRPTHTSDVCQGGLSVVTRTDSWHDLKIFFM